MREKLKFVCRNCQRYRDMCKRYPDHNSRTNVKFTCNCEKQFRMAKGSLVYNAQI